MELYNEPIDEFVDWVDGTNYITKAIDTLDQSGNALPVSGEQIRNLLQKRLRKPVFVKKGNDNMIRFFSSEKAWETWNAADDDEEYKKDLVLYEFAEPSQYKIQVTGLLIGEKRHIIYGDKGSQESKAVFLWAVKFGDEYIEDESIAVTYKVENSLYATPKSRNMIYTNRLETVTYDLLDMLDLGTNNVTITLRGQTTGATTSIPFSIVMVSLNLASQFKFYSAAIADEIRIPYQLYRNDYSEAVLIHAYIDGQLVASDTKHAGVRQDDGEIVIPNFKDLSGNRPYGPSEQSLDPAELNKVHSLQLQAETNYNGSPFKSNLLYYEFAVAADSAVANAIITTFTDFPSAQSQVSPFASLTLIGQQFQRQTLSWAYHTDKVMTDTSVSVTWKIQKGEDDNVISLTTLPTMNGNKGVQSTDLSFEPPVYSDKNNNVYLDAYIGARRIKRIPMVITKSELSVKETTNYTIKLNAAGKTNQSVDRDTWITEGSVEAPVAFSSNVRWDDQQGWYNNSLRLSGVNNYAIVPYNPFSYTSKDDKPEVLGRTIEVEFEVEKVVSEDDVVMLFGGENGARIEIKPTKAILYDVNGSSRILTNYKDNERVKIAFIINGSTTTTIDRNLAYIVTNGILERAALVQGYEFYRQTGSIKIGGSASGVKLYNLRVYNGRISYHAAYNNYVFDSENKAQISANNDIFDDNGNISYDKCRNKIDTILISGNLTNILSSQSDKDKSETDVTISRHCPSDSTKDFVCEGCRIRKHGLSTLYYPITSMKFWFNKSVRGTTPKFTCDGQKSLGLAKNRYKMKDSSIPANKFVLQANYADSSGVHNGGLLRLIQESWYNARVDDKFVLRTEPQLFSSVDVSDKGKYGLEHVWKEYTDGKEFPYQLQISADSFPCVVFYQNTADDDRITYLGQYVFMEDKKSDFNYGERSIYKSDPKDPFCLTTANKKGDSDANKVWDNSNVLQVEVVNVNTPFVSYMQDYMTENGQRIDCMDVIEAKQVNTQQQQQLNLEEEQEQEKEPDILYERHYRWEEDFELIYPDPEDVAGRQAGPYVDNKGVQKIQDVDTTKFANPENSKFCQTAKPFIDWFRWLTSTYGNHAKFQREAADHLDLYKLAAYYIFFLRFGLVDSVERNVQLKTYDGVHWHYEPWDMDIALGNRNTGGIAFDPPIDRNTHNPGLNGQPDMTSWALSGRSTSTSNWLWDALENWQDWQLIVRKVADSLYRAGLTYNRCIEMFDDNYANKWCETIYNESGYFKYIKSGGGSKQWLPWLQGARMPHRHWWLSTSMDYYDAKWRVGDYVDHKIQYRGSHAVNDPAAIQFVAARQTYFIVELETTTLATITAPAGQTLTYDFTQQAFTERNNITLYGAKNLQSLKLGALADALGTLNVQGAYSDVLGACLKTLDIGTSLTQSDINTYTGTVNVRGQEIGLAYMSEDRSLNALEALQTLNIRGQLSIQSIVSMVYDAERENLDLSLLLYIYAMGSGLQQFSSSYRGNAFEVVELPDTVRSIYMRNSNWNSLEFWHTGEITSTEQGLVDTNGNPIIDSTTGIQDTIQKNTTTITRLPRIPSTVNKLELLGSTGRYNCSKELVFDWITSILADNNNDTSALANYELVMDDLRWDQNTCDTLVTFDQLALLAKINGLADETDPEQKATKRRKIRGYLVLKAEEGNLSMEQLSLIRSWFGDTVFQLSAVGSGLVVDYAYDFSQISLGAPAYFDNDLFYLKEGKNASLSITSFHLQESSQQNQWFLRRYVNGQLSGSPTNSVFPFKVEQDAEGVWRVSASEGIGTATTAYLYTSVTLPGQSPSYPGIDITSVPVVYPTGYNFDIQYYSGTDNRGTDEVINIYSDGNAFELYLKPQGVYDATITDVVFSISADEGELNDTIGLSYKDLPNAGTNINGYLQYRKSTSPNPEDKYGIRINSFGVIPTDATYFTVTALIKFNNASKNTTKTIRIMVLEDSTPIVSAAAGTDLYRHLLECYEKEFGISAPTDFYKYHLAKMTYFYVGNFTWSGTFWDDGGWRYSTSSYSSIDNILCLTGESVFKYLTNLKHCEIYASSLPLEYEGVFLFDLRNNTKLERFLIYIQSSVGTIDFSYCPNIRNISLGPELSAILPNTSSIRYLRLDKPHVLKLNECFGAYAFLSIRLLDLLTEIEITNISSIHQMQINNEDSVYDNNAYLILMKILTNSRFNIANLTKLLINPGNSTLNISAAELKTLNDIIQQLETNNIENVSLSGSLLADYAFYQEYSRLTNFIQSVPSKYGDLSITVLNMVTELEYISSTSSGGLYVKFSNITDGLKRSKNFNIKFKIKVYSGSGWGAIAGFLVVGPNSAASYFGYVIFRDGHGIYEIPHSRITSDLNKHQIETIPNTDELLWTCTGITNLREYLRMHSYTPSSGTTYYPLTVGADYNGSYQCPMDIYYFQYYNASGSLVLDCVPAQASNGSIGLFDKVSGTLYTSNRNSFVAGPAVIYEEPEEETEP